MRDTIQRVMAAEDEAAHLVGTAREEAEAFLGECRRQARELSEKRQRETLREAEELLRSTEEEAHHEREERIRQVSTELTNSLHLDAALASRAVKSILHCVCGRGTP